MNKPVNTSVDEAVLRDVAQASVTLPDVCCYSVFFLSKTHFFRNVCRELIFIKDYKKDLLMLETNDSNRRMSLLFCCNYMC
jgi:hypothetical protein